MKPFLNTSPLVSPQKPKLLDQLRGAIRLRHSSIRTEETSVQRVRRFILFHGKRHPEGMGPLEFEAFLTHLAVEGKVASSTQNQALNAIVFLYKEVIKQSVGILGEIARAKRPERARLLLVDSSPSPCYSLSMS